MSEPTVIPLRLKEDDEGVWWTADPEGEKVVIWDGPYPDQDTALREAAKMIATAAVAALESN